MRVRRSVLSLRSASVAASSSWALRTDCWAPHTRPAPAAPHAPVEAVELDLGKLLEHARDVHEGPLGRRAALGDAPKLDHRDLQVLRRGLGHRKARGDALILRGGETRLALLAGGAIAHLQRLDPLRAGVQRASGETERAGSDDAALQLPYLITAPLGAARELLTRRLFRREM